MSEWHTGEGKDIETVYPKRCIKARSAPESKLEHSHVERQRPPLHHHILSEIYCQRITICMNEYQMNVSMSLWNYIELSWSFMSPPLVSLVKGCWIAIRLHQCGWWLDQSMKYKSVNPRKLGGSGGFIYLFTKSCNDQWYQLWGLRLWTHKNIVDACQSS